MELNYELSGIRKEKGHPDVLRARLFDFNIHAKSTFRRDVAGDFEMDVVDVFEDLFVKDNDLLSLSRSDGYAKLYLRGRLPAFALLHKSEVLNDRGSKLRQDSIMTTVEGERLGDVDNPSIHEVLTECLNLMTDFYEADIVHDDLHNYNVIRRSSGKYCAIDLEDVKSRDSRSENWYKFNYVELVAETLVESNIFEISKKIGQEKCNPKSAIYVSFSLLFGKINFEFLKEQLDRLMPFVPSARKENFPKMSEAKMEEIVKAILKLLTSIPPTMIDHFVDSLSDDISNETFLEFANKTKALLNNFVLE